LLGAKRAAELLRQLAGGTVANGIIDNYPNPRETVTVQLDLNYARRLSGLDLSPEEIAGLLRRLEFIVEPLSGEQLPVKVPDHRMDVEGGHDLVEEICRMYGYDRIPVTTLSDELPPQRGNPMLEMEESVKDILVQAGMQEIITLRLTSAAREAKLIPRSSGLGPDVRPYVTVTNPISPDRALMRHSVLASVLDVAAGNSRYQDRIALFEIGPVFMVDEEEILPHELTRLVAVMTGYRGRYSWQDGAPPLMDFFDMKGLLERLFYDLRLPVEYEAATHPTFRQGRTARILLDEIQIGIMGELHPLVVAAYEIRAERRQPVLAADLNFDAIFAHAPARSTYDSISSYPAVREDLALVVGADVTSASVERAIRQAGGFLLKRAELFDVYVGDQIPAGQKSLAYHLTFQSPDKTLNDKEVRRQRERILKQLGRQLGARLRE
jgi:phenylalanyl-tRNA synthetase beta chain